MTERAECLVLGGHSIDSQEPLFGMAVIGEVHPDRMLTNAGACAGDRLVLTKPLGTGILPPRSSATRCSRAAWPRRSGSMTTLNDGAARAALTVGVSAATDVTGFGLLGHLGNILRGQRGRRGDRVRRDPVPGARPQPRRPGRRARRHPAEPRGRRGGGLGRRPRARRPLLCADAQTSGGLLLAVPPENEAALVEALREAETPAAAVIGRLTDGTGRVGPGRPARLTPADRPSADWTSPWLRPLDRRPHGPAGARRPRRGSASRSSRRGTEYVVAALRVTTVDQHDALVGRLPMTGEELTFRLDEIDSFQVIG